MKKELPGYLSEILNPTPSGVPKLIAAWDILSGETQINILLSLEELKYPTYHLLEKIYPLALNSKNAYIRYLAAKHIHLDDKKPEHQEIKKKIKNDESPLVKYSSGESSDFSSIFDNALKDPEVFFNMPHEARLAKVRTLSGDGERIAKLFINVEKYITEKKLTEMEAYEILADYVASPGFVKRYQVDKKLGYDGYAEYSKGKDVEELWKIVPLIPKTVAYPLLGALPETAGLSGLPTEILGKLDPHQLSQVFFRDEISLSGFRKQIFFSADNPDVSEYANSELRSAASSRHFDLTQQEFASLLPKGEADEKAYSTKFKDAKDQENFERLRDLGMMAGDLSWVYLRAIHDLFLALPGSAYEDAQWPKRRLEHLLENAKSNKSSYSVQRQALELKLYQLAVTAVPWKGNEKYNPRSDLNFLNDAIVKNDTWATYMAFSNKWKEQNNAKKLEKLLPEIYGFDDDETDSNSDDASDAQTKEIKNINYETAIKNIESSTKKIKALAYIIIGLIAWILLR